MQHLDLTILWPAQACRQYIKIFQGFSRLAGIHIILISSVPTGIILIIGSLCKNSGWNQNQYIKFVYSAVVPHGQAQEGIVGPEVVGPGFQFRFQPCFCFVLFNFALFPRFHSVF